jgi:hypothetical protein
MKYLDGLILPQLFSQLHDNRFVFWTLGNTFGVRNVSPIIETFKVEANVRIIDAKSPLMTLE